MQQLGSLLSCFCLHTPHTHLYSLFSAPWTPQYRLYYPIILWRSPNDLTTPGTRHGSTCLRRPPAAGVLSRYALRPLQCMPEPTSMVVARNWRRLRAYAWGSRRGRTQRGQHTAVGPRAVHTARFQLSRSTHPAPPALLLPLTFRRKSTRLCSRPSSHDGQTHLKSGSSTMSYPLRFFRRHLRRLSTLPAGTLISTTSLQVTIRAPPAR